MKKHGDKKTRRNYTKSSKAELRREAVTSGVILGKTEPQIAGELGISRGRVAQIKAESGFRVRIAARIAQAQIETDEVLGTLASIMRASLEDFLEIPESGHARIKLDFALKNGVLHLVKELSYSPDGTIKIKLHDALAAAVQLSRIMNLDKSQQGTVTLTISQIRAALARKNKR